MARRSEIEMLYKVLYAGAKLLLVSSLWKFPSSTPIGCVRSRPAKCIVGPVPVVVVLPDQAMP